MPKKRAQTFNSRIPTRPGVHDKETSAKVRSQRTISGSSGGGTAPKRVAQKIPASKRPPGGKETI